MVHIKAAVIARDASALKRIREKLKDTAFTIDEKNPDIVFVYGGDGSILCSERLYPGIKKVAIRGSKTSKTCFYEESILDKIISRIKQGAYDVQEYTKVCAKYRQKKIDALNEIQVRSRQPFVALRFRVYIDSILKHEDIIGDGILVSTPFGSGAYYYSIGGEPFEKGLGLGINNPHERTKSYVIPEDAVVTIEIKRGDALLIRDNDEFMVNLKAKDRVIIRKSSGVARFLRFPGINDD